MVYIISHNCCMRLDYQSRFIADKRIAAVHVCETRLYTICAKFLQVISRRGGIISLVNNQIVHDNDYGCLGRDFSLVQLI